MGNIPQMPSAGFSTVSNWTFIFGVCLQFPGQSDFQINIITNFLSCSTQFFGSGQKWKKLIV